MGVSFSRTPPSRVRSQAVILTSLRPVRGRFRLPDRSNALFAALVDQVALDLCGGAAGRDRCDKIGAREVAGAGRGMTAGIWRAGTAKGPRRAVITSIQERPSIRDSASIGKTMIITTLEPADLYRMQIRELREYAMFTIDPQGTITSWNGGVETLLGYPEEEWIGKHASIIFTPEDRAVEVCESEMRLAQETGSATDIRWHRQKDGTQFFANGVMNALRDDQGVLIGYAKILSDETARKQLQDSLTESNTALEQFAYVASHDLQEPLRTMSAYSQMLINKYRGKLDPDADQYLNFLVSASARMSALIRDLLAYARLATEEERPSSIALDEDLEAALTNLDQAIKDSGASVTHDPMPTLAVDRGQMVRLFQNLIGNAVKYRKSNEPPQIHVSAEQNGAEWVISIRDNGIGFDPQFASAIFAPFKRLHSADEYPGTGVGLAICGRIVEAQRGRIWAESKPGEGATFYFTLPVESPQPLKHTPPIDEYRSGASVGIAGMDVALRGRDPARHPSGFRGRRPT
jgi:PAS domain S-box-containing protein